MSGSYAIRELPHLFGEYLLLEQLAVGGMAEVYKAKASGVEGFERFLAVKRILPNISQDSQFVTMFIDEAKIAGLLSHANIAQIFDLGKVDENYFIAMEYVHGQDLRALIENAIRTKEPVPIPLVCFMISKVCEGLEYAHNKRGADGKKLNLVHRDVSPQNILVSYEGEVKVIDFGIAKAVGRAGKTQSGILKGKFGYMSPEQVRGLPVDRRSDVFTAGICLFEALSCRRLFSGESDFSVLEKVRNVEMMPLSAHDPSIPEELERVVLRALAKNVEDRYASAAELRRDLDAYVMRNHAMCGQEDLARYMQDQFKTKYRADLKKDAKYQRLDMSKFAQPVPATRAARYETLPPASTPAEYSLEDSLHDTEEEATVARDTGSGRRNIPQKAASRHSATKGDDWGGASSSESHSRRPGSMAASASQGLAYQGGAAEMLQVDEEEDSTSVYEDLRAALPGLTSGAPVNGLPTVNANGVYAEGSRQALYGGWSVPKARSSNGYVVPHTAPPPPPRASRLSPSQRASEPMEWRLPRPPARNSGFVPVVDPQPEELFPDQQPTNGHLRGEGRGPHVGVAAGLLNPPSARSAPGVASAGFGAELPTTPLLEGSDVGEVLPAEEASPAYDLVREEDGRSRRPWWLMLLAFLAVVGIGLALYFLLRADKLGTIQLVTEPQDATVYFDNKPLLATSSPFVIPDVDPETTHLLVVRRAKYAPWTKHIHLQPGQTLVLPTVKLRPAEAGKGSVAHSATARSVATAVTEVPANNPAATELVLETSPPGARIYLNNRIRPERTPARISGLDPGNYKLRFEREGLAPHETNIVVKNGEVLELPVVQLASPPLSITVKSVPDSARVELLRGGKVTEIGRTPVSFEVERAGAPAKLRVLADGFMPTVEELRGMEDESAASFNIRLLPERSDASSENRGEKAARKESARSAGGTRREANNERGSSRRKGRRNRSKRDGGEEAEAKGTSGGADGTLRLNSRPWSKVTIDGKTIGNTPQLNLKLSPGTHKVVLENDEFGMKKTIRVRIRPGQATTKVVDLTK